MCRARRDQSIDSMTRASAWTRPSRNAARRSALLLTPVERRKAIECMVGETPDGYHHIPRARVKGILALGVTLTEEVELTAGHGAHRVDRAGIIKRKGAANPILCLLRAIPIQTHDLKRVDGYVLVRSTAGRTTSGTGKCTALPDLPADCLVHTFVDQMIGVDQRPEPGMYGFGVRVG